MPETKLLIFFAASLVATNVLLWWLDRQLNQREHE